jgi:hypothetical protein
MANIDIPVPENLKNFLEAPKCIDLTLPKVKIPTITLPTGSKLKGMADVSKGIPTDCSVTFSLLLQIGPILASMECLLKLLKVVGAILDAVKDPLKIPDMITAAVDIKECILIPTGLNLPIFVKDLLCLILKILKCAVGSLKSVAQLMQGLTLSLDAAAQEGNEDLIATLKCAQGNAQTQADSIMTSIEPLAVLLDLASGVMKMAQVAPISLSLPAGGQGADAILQVTTVLDGVVEILEAVVEPLGGCS